jgi:hypothetical protein
LAASPRKQIPIIIAGKRRREEINIRQLSYWKATEKKRVPDHLDNVVGGQQEKQKCRHQSDTSEIAGANVKEARKNDH